MSFPIGYTVNDHYAIPTGEQHLFRVVLHQLNKFRRVNLHHRLDHGSIPATHNWHMADITPDLPALRSRLKRRSHVFISVLSDH